MLDAHFTVLVMTPQAKGLLQNLQCFVKSQVTNEYYSFPVTGMCTGTCFLNMESVCVQVRLFLELGQIEGSLQELDKMKTKEDVGQYSIEVIELY